MIDSKCIPLIGVIVFTLCVVAYSFPCDGKTVLVSKSGDGADGQTWETAYREIGTAIQNSATGDEIWVATGTYVETLTTVVPLTILGGFSGTETLDQGELRAPEDFPTVIDGNRQGTVLTVRHCCPVKSRIK